MALRTTNSAESWEQLYKAFSEVNFTSYDFDSIKQSLIDYTKTYFPEQFNDYIQSSEYIALLEMFAYVAEQLAYRVDMLSHENFITTAQRKQSILRLAKLISYKATRNIPVRGLVKINSVTTTERVIDSRGQDLSGLTIVWNDPNNGNWKEQFILVMNRLMTNRYGQPHKSFQIGDIVMDLYSMRNDPALMKNGVFSYSAQAGQDSYPMEIVPSDIDENGPYEREPDTQSPFSLIFANDGIGDGSDYTGFLMFTKQGTLTRIDYDLTDALPDRTIDFAPTNVNHTDVWVQELGSLSEIVNRWVQVDSLHDENLVFNGNRTTRKKYEVSTRENDQISVSFGDNDFSDIPQGVFRFWMRQSANKSLVIQKNKVSNVPMSITYTSGAGDTETCSFSFSLTTTLQNGSATETIEHIRKSAPSTYYAQNRMVNGQDYNTYPLKDPTILRLKAVNRTFAGQPKHVDWNDASGTYQNVKLFGDDASLRQILGITSQTTTVSGQSLIDNVIEPLLSTPGVVNLLNHISANSHETRGVVSAPRRKFVEDNRGDLYKSVGGGNVPYLGQGSADGSLKEKTAIQGLIDRHWYGEPLAYVQDSNGNILAQIVDPDTDPTDDSKIYASSVPRTVDGVNKFPPGDTGSGLQPIAEQEYFALRFNNTLRAIGSGNISISPTFTNTTPAETWTIEIKNDGESFSVKSSSRGAFADGRVGDAYSINGEYFFTVAADPLGDAFVKGDAFVLDGNVQRITAGSTISQPNFNLTGWWEIMGFSQLPAFAAGVNSSAGHDLMFTTDTSTSNTKQYSWVIFVRKIRNSQTQSVVGYEVHARDLKLTIKSDTTKFWYNDVDQIIDPETKNRVYDNIKILRSNLTNTGGRLKKNDKYDVVGDVRNAFGTVDFNQLEIVPTDLLQEDTSGNLVSDRILQFENFVKSADNTHYEYFAIQNPTNLINPPDNLTWADGSFVDSSLTYGRRPLADNNGEGLDFMWQHFSPFTNIVDPSPTNIHDLYVLTQGYYDNITNFVRRLTNITPSAPTPLELKNSYGYLFENKMLSDTVVMHPGKIRLMFGNLAEPQLRARFKVVRSPGGTLTDERVKEEILSVINTFFDIDNWDFGTTFYATALITLIHQRLPADVASVVLVPLYSTNSFGSMFSVEPGFDEILQSAAELSDIEIVDALTPAVIRQVV
jgi:hypothetical protein